MNHLIRTIDTNYLRSSRTIETILVSDFNTERIFYVYNYEGYSFRVFETVLHLMDFFYRNIDTKFHFENEIELDDFFSNIDLKK